MEDEIVITGMSGRFPESDNVAEFGYNLFNKVDLMTESTKRWEPGLYGLPINMGMIKDISKFDNTFFGVHHKQAHQLDPQARMLLELTYETIVDSGYDPEELRGRNIGVFIGNCSSESDEFFTYDEKKINGYAMTGCCRAMFANRVSYTFDFKGPSLLMDTACSSGALALYEAVQSIKNNECEAAIVGGANLCLRPGTALQFYKLNMLSDDGKCKSFDAACNGYGRSEAVVTLLLQKANVARRVYANLVHIKTNTDGFKEDGVTFPSAQMQKSLINQVYQESKVNPLDVSFVEAHGTGTPAGDPIEMSAISDIFCKGRKEVLLAGSVKSNIGHSEPASGLCSVVKVLIAMENGLIPPNLHFKTPNPEIDALVSGRVKIITDPTPWNGGYAALSCFGFGGVNVHAVLKSNPNKQRLKIDKHSSFPQLALYSGRIEDSVKTVFDFIEKEEVTREFFALLHKSVYSQQAMKPYRGYKIVGSEDPIVDIKNLGSEKRPVWYIFSGMGTQWPGMAKDLMNLEIFSKTIYRLAEVLKPFDLDLVSLVMHGASKDDNKRTIIPAFVSIAAVQIALVDVLTALDIVPDGMVGHSVGELGCAYADGCLTGEQMVLASYWRGKAVEDSDLVDGAMAALGLTWAQAKERCPEAVYPSCHNAEDSVTISGPKANVSKFVASLKAENVFAREVDSCGYAFHSQYIFPAAGKLQQALDQIIPTPKARTSRWVSSSYPEDSWDDPKSKVSDASYFVHNLVSPVLFHEALRHVPKNALVVEIAPHHLLQAILKRVIGGKAEYIGLMKRNVNNAEHLLTSIGQLYINGLNPNIEKLYPAVKLPVPLGTPMISSLIKWDHSESWSVAKWDKKDHHSQMIVEVNTGAEDSPDATLVGHCIDGRNLYPATGYLMLVWKALAELKRKDVTTMPVMFENVKIHRATVLSKSNITKFIVDVMSAGGEFEISENGMAVVTGRVFVPEETASTGSEKYWSTTKLDMKLNSNDVYKELRLRGYDYGPTFQGIVESDLTGKQGLLKWSGDWTVFLDTMLQFSMLSSPNRALCLPTRLPNMKIDPLAHKKIVEGLDNAENGVPIVHHEDTHRVIAGGAELQHLKASIAPRQPSRQTPLLEQYRFTPYNETNILSKHEKKNIEKYIHVCSSVAKKILEAEGKNKDQIIDVLNGYTEVDESVISTYLKNMSTEHVLLKQLQLILLKSDKDELSKVAKTSLLSYLENKELDLLENTMADEIPLRSVLDVVLENVTSRKLKVFEVHNGKSPLSIKINKLLQNFTLQQANFTVAHSNPEILDQESIASNAIQTTTWSLSSDILPDINDVDMLLIKNINCSKKDLKQSLEKITALVKPNGFILLSQKTHTVPAEMFLSALSEVAIPVFTDHELQQAFDASNLVSVCKKSDSLISSLYLLRKVDHSTERRETVVQVKSDEFEWVEKLKQELAKPEMVRIWLVSQADPNSGMIGLVNCLRQEPGGSNIKCIFVTPSGNVKIPEFKPDHPYYKDIINNNLTMNVFQKGEWGSFRHVSLETKKETILSDHAYLNALTRGDLSSLRWIDSPLKHFTSVPLPNGILCHVYYASLNFRDIMLASGKLPADAIPGKLALQDCILGFEFSGRDSKGKRIMGLVSHKGLATTVATDPEFVWEVPENWTLEEASTVPVAYSTAYYALLVRGGLKKGEKVLIHSGSGGVGQAAIAIALDMGCQVYTTVGTTEKREFLKRRFPQLKDKNFCNSRDISFEQHILSATNGEGVDVVLNSLADEKLKASLNCLANHGQFLEIGKYDLSNNSPLGMAVFLKNMSFHGILLDALFEDKSKCTSTKNEVVRLVQEGIKSGTVRPLNTILFENDQAEQAFRYMASGRHIGKVVLKIRDEEPNTLSLPTPVTLPAIPRTICNPNKSYIIIGGLGGFGLELCQWLVDRGANNIILTSRSGVTSGYQQLCLNRWKKISLNVVVSKLNATCPIEAEKLLKEAAKLAPVGGIFNLALVLRDAFMENQTAENYRAVCESKVKSTNNLDALSRKMCPDLEWFVCYSSVSCGRGNAGQSNYGYANSVMERICEKRSADGLPGLAIQWGAIGDVGIIQETVGTEVVVGGTVPQRIVSCFSVLDEFLQQRHPVVSSFVPYRPAESASSKSAKHNVLATVANIFGIKDISTISLETSLGELGMDSLMGVEIQQFLERDHELVMSIQELRLMKIKDLKKLESGSDKPADQEEDLEVKAVPSLENIKDISSLSIQHLVPAETVVPLNAQKKGVPLFIVHPIEGVVNMLESVARNIDAPVFGLQCTPDAKSSSLEELAVYYLKKIKGVSAVNGNIHLAGYSFGASVAFEMALQAERNPKSYPKIKELIMLDGSPALVTTYAREHESHFLIDSQVEGEAQALCAFILLFGDANIRELKKILLKMSSLEERVNFVSEKIVGMVKGLSKSEVAQAFDLYYNKLLISLKYTPKNKLHRDVALLRASVVVDLTQAFSEKYDIEKVCTGSISVHPVNGTHKTFIQGENALQTSKILNTLLKE